MHRARRLSAVLAIGCILLAWLADHSIGRTVNIPGEGMSISLPDGWIMVEQQGAALFATSPDHTADISLRVAANSEQKGVNESFYLDEITRVRRKKADFDHASLVNLEAGNALVGGVTAAFIHTEEAMPDGRTYYNRDYLIAANGKFYALALDSSDPYTDQKLEKVAASVTFSRQPQEPDGERSYHARIRQVTIGGVAAVVALGLIARLTFKYRRR